MMQAALLSWIVELHSMMEGSYNSFHNPDAKRACRCSHCALRGSVSVVDCEHCFLAHILRLRRVCQSLVFPCELTLSWAGGS